MGGPVTHSVLPYAATVTVGDSNGASPASGSAPTVTPLSVLSKVFGNDDLDDGTPTGQARAEAYIKEQVANGTFKQSDLDKGNVTPSQIDNTKTEIKSGIPADCSAIHQHYDLSTLIGTSTTLGNFIKDYPAIPNQKYNSVPAQLGLQPDQIVCNLSHLCINAWEPIKQQYPNVVLTNSLRTGDAVGAGPHGTGQAMDIQFFQGGQSIAPAEYFVIAQWIKSNIAFDQLLLEYSTAKGPLIAWIHISTYKDSGIQVKPINRVLTMMNHKLTNVGLANLA